MQGALAVREREEGVEAGMEAVEGSEEGSEEGKEVEAMMVVAVEGIHHLCL